MRERMWQPLHSRRLWFPSRTRLSRPGEWYRLRRRKGEPCEPAEILESPGGWTVRLTARPLAAQGATRGAAVAAMVTELRRYASAWPQLAGAPGHAGGAQLALFAGAATDRHLTGWVERQAADGTPPPAGTSRRHGGAGPGF